MWSDSEMMERLKKALAELHGSMVGVQALEDCNREEKASIILGFVSGERLRGAYWRVVGSGAPMRLSNFDHLQQYGLLAPIDAIQELQELLRGRLLSKASLEERTGDVVLDFDGDVSLQLLNVSGYEVWEFYFTDGDGAWSNYA
jgi:hypothetical protein